MKQIIKVIVAVIALGASLFLATQMGFSIQDFISSIHINVEAILLVTIVITFLLAIKYLLKLLLGLFKSGKFVTFYTIANSALDYVTMILIVVWSLRILGADINGIIAGIGILALIIGTSAEGIIEDMLTGVFMLFEQECKVGDIIEVDGFLGTVSEIGIRTTTLIDAAGNEKIFNNSSMKDILNRSTHESVAVVDIELPNDTDIEKVISANYGDITCLGLEEVQAESVLVRYIKKCTEDEIYDVRRRMNLDILNKLKELGIK